MKTKNLARLLFEFPDGDDIIFQRVTGEVSAEVSIVTPCDSHRPSRAVLYRRPRV